MFSDAADVGQEIEVLLSQTILDCTLGYHPNTLSSSRLTASDGGELK
jgi:hypothetical protein